jgi:hypothetical protein
VLFDADTDTAREGLPPEAHRRFRADFAPGRSAISTGAPRSSRFMKKRSASSPNGLRATARPNSRTVRL